MGPFFARARSVPPVCAGTGVRRGATVVRSQSGARLGTVDVSTGRRRVRPGPRAQRSVRGCAAAEESHAAAGQEACGQAGEEAGRQAAESEKIREEIRQEIAEDRLPFIRYS